MTPREKVKELFIKCNTIIHKNELDYRFLHTYQNDPRWTAGKQLATLAVDEILSAICFNMYDEDAYNKEVDYWQEVKQEIEVL